MASRAASDLCTSVPGTGPETGSCPGCVSDETGRGDARDLASAWLTQLAQASSRRNAANDALLASDADRDQAVRQLTDAFTQGRLAAAELDDRTGRALAARTRGELDAVLSGLGGLARPMARRPVRAATFWLATVLLSPFVLFGGLFVLFGNDLGDHVFGLVLLALTGSPLFAVWRWWRRPD